MGQTVAMYSAAHCSTGADRVMTLGLRTADASKKKQQQAWVWNRCRGNVFQLLGQ
jgi:hypothetical protein